MAELSAPSSASTSPNSLRATRRADLEMRVVPPCHIRGDEARFELIQYFGIDLAPGGQ